MFFETGCLLLYICLLLSVCLWSDQRWRARRVDQADRSFLKLFIQKLLTLIDFFCVCLSVCSLSMLKFTVTQIHFQEIKTGLQNLFCYLEASDQHFKTIRELIIFPCLHFRRLWRQIKFIVSSCQNLNSQRQTFITDPLCCTSSRNYPSWINLSCRVTTAFLSSLKGPNWDCILLCLQSASLVQTICLCFFQSSKCRFFSYVSPWLTESAPNHHLTEVR